MDTLLQKLFRGELSPYEDPAPNSEEYRTALHNQSDALEALRSSLNEHQISQLDHAHRCIMQTAGLELEKVYGDGVRFGVQLMLELFYDHHMH
jgi:hypothetical protein